MNGIIVIDKPAGWTSHDVVAKLRRIMGERRIGHGGTLDPMATGVLPIFVGRATRAVEFMENADKEYVAGIKFGITTDTQDITGNIMSTNERTVTRDRLSEILPRFTGEQEQVPPMYSALKHNGKKLYELARKGVEVERKARKITISDLEIVDFGENEAILRVVCSKGTYIRTLCHDIGQALDCGAVMSSLRRTRAGAYTEADAVQLADASPEMLIPIDTVFAKYPACTVGEPQEKKICCGADFKTDTTDGMWRVYGEKGEFLMLGRADGGVMTTVKSFFEV